MKRFFGIIFVLLLFTVYTYGYHHEGELIVQFKVDGQEATYCYVAVNSQPDISWGRDDYDFDFSFYYLVWNSAYTFSSFPPPYETGQLIENHQPALFIKRFYMFKMQFGYYGHIILPADTYFVFQFIQNTDNSDPFEGHWIYFCVDIEQNQRIVKRRYVLNKYLHKLTPVKINLNTIQVGEYYEPIITAYIIISPKPLFCFWKICGGDFTDWKDYAEIVKDYHRPEGFYNGDINGDGVVDNFDISEFSKHWLYQKQDLNADGRVNLIDYAVIANKWGKRYVPDYTGRDGFFDGTVDYWDLAMITEKIK